MNDIAVLIPTLNRSYKLEAVAKNIHEATTTPHTIYFIVEKEDTDSISKIKELKEKYIVNSAPNTYVAAINNGYLQSTEPLIFCGADDLGFTTGWDIETLKDFKNPKIQMIGYPDEWPISKTGLHGSHFAVRREYIEKQGGAIGEKNTIYFSEYEHQHCDVEIEQTAQMRGVWKQSKATIEHLHWSHGKSQLDETYRRAIETDGRAWKTYKSRRYLFEQQIFSELFHGRIVKPFRGKLSIVIPSYFNKKYLEQTVESLKENTFNPYELIIIDDCSDKETTDYIKTLDCKKVFNKKQKYVTANWNTGVKMATGDYIAILNNDITLSDYWDCYLMDALKGDVLAANPYQTDAGEMRPYGKSPRTGNIDIRGTCFMFKKGLFESFNFLPEELKIWHSDTWLGWYIIQKLHKKTIYVSQSIVFHYGSISSKDFDKRTGKLREIIESDSKEFEKLTGFGVNKIINFGGKEKIELITVVPKITGACERSNFMAGRQCELPLSVIQAVGHDNFEFIQ